MSWKRAGVRDLLELEKFIIRTELDCVPFSAWLKERVIYWHEIKKDFYIYIKVTRVSPGLQSRIKEAVLISRYGIILPIFETKNQLFLHNKHDLGFYLNSYPGRIHSVMGITQNVNVVEKLLNRIIKLSIPYHFMVLDKENIMIENSKLPRNLTIRAADSRDVDALFDLQKKYELEEVYIDKSLFSERVCRMHLRKNLKKQIIYVAEVDGKPVAKAGTNARGYRVDQIGGVYTRQSIREKGVAYLLMLKLLSQIFKEKEKCSLFVKKGNTAAIKLYKKLGFKVKGSYRITYFMQ